ncbi:hypothetical protein NP493_2g06014 [Ridgeia piscesae]|uniref:Regulator of MON1-CCZ1 complex N-terminal domain-containing protein n=1 Tax=Ridgeia piscesae TaxID=27915 RepID=A0AAD9PGD6_RIDPI|nr:hypothetical protein NP493_2g06014 [Ridgeia piscesae]
MAETDKEMENFYIQLSNNPVRFEPVSKVTNVFFDDSNRQVFAVRSGGVMGVVVKSSEEKMNISFRMEDLGEVISIKFSYDMKILAIQRSDKSVEFVNYKDGLELVEYSQSCKGKSAKIIGFNWTNINEIVFVTNHGLELYQVSAEKKTLKLLKTYSVTVNWYVWLPQSAVLLLSTGAIGNLIQPFHFRLASMLKLPKFEVDLPVIPKPPKLCLFDRDVTMANLYDQLYVVVLRHHVRTSQGTAGAEIALYLVQRESPARKTDILKLGVSGRFAINVVDNLIVVHHKASKTSMLFDIKLGGESDGFINYHHPVLSPLPIRPFKQVHPGKSVNTD